MTTIDGQRVIGISGGVPTVAVAGGKGTATLYVTASSHPLPVRVSMSASAAGRPKAAVTGTLSDWGERVTVKAPTQPLQLGQLSTLEQQLAGLSIPGAPGYLTFTGSRGDLAPVGRPWGQACKPIRLAAAADVPSWFYAQMATVTDAARKQGVDVVLETRRLSWRPGSLYYRRGQSPVTSAVVAVTIDDGTPPKQSDGQPEHIGLGWDTKLDRDKHNEDLTEVQGTLWMKALAGQFELVRRSIRQLIAWSQGISRTTDAVSGISNTTTDRFTKDDIAAMLKMSGCTKPTSVLGIAA